MSEQIVAAVVEVRKRQRDMESSIAEVINRFQVDTGCVVIELDVKTIYRVGHSGAAAAIVTATVELPRG